MGLLKPNILFSEKPVIGFLLLLSLSSCIEYKLTNPETRNLQYIIKGNHYDSLRMQMKNLIRLHVEGNIDSLNLDINSSRVEYRFIVPSASTIRLGDLHPEYNTKDKDNLHPEYFFTLVRYPDAGDADTLVQIARNEKTIDKFKRNYYLFPFGRFYTLK